MTTLTATPLCTECKHPLTPAEIEAGETACDNCAAGFCEDGEPRYQGNNPMTTQRFTVEVNHKVVGQSGNIAEAMDKFRKVRSQHVKDQIPALVGVFDNHNDVWVEVVVVN